MDTFSNLLEAINAELTDIASRAEVLNAQVVELNRLLETHLAGGDQQDI